MNLTALANQFQSDKGTIVGNPAHKYTYLYDLIFYPLRNKNLNFLEMGLAIGGPELGGAIDRHVVSPSIKMWIEYFPHAAIYGFDISDFSHMSHPRFKFIRGDSGRLDDVERLSDSAGHFDIVIDDASHASYHQQLALKVLWRKLASGGLYVIEDLHWQSPVFENVLPSVPKTSDLLKNIFEKDIYLDGPLLDETFIRSIKSEAFSFSAFNSFNENASPIKQIVLRKR
jgi:hypothetical protein